MSCFFPQSVRRPYPVEDGLDWIGECDGMLKSAIVIDCGHLWTIHGIGIRYGKTVVFKPHIYIEYTHGNAIF